MSKPLVLITGATGFIGAHILLATVEAGYPVRVVARSEAKAAPLKERFGDKIQIVIVEDFSTADLTDALKGVGAILHIASPIVGREPSNELMLKGSIEPTLNFLKQAVAAGVPKFIATSSWVSHIDYSKTPQEQYVNDYVYSEKDWNPVTTEQVLKSDNGFFVYAASKALAEREIWKFAETHPEIDITTVNPPFVYGPLAPGVTLAKGNIAGLSTLGFIYQSLLSGGKVEKQQLSIMPMGVDVRDVAKAHVLAISSPPASKVGQKRILISAPSWQWIDAVKFLSEKRPELKGRLPDISEAEKIKVCTFDPSRAETVLGLKEYIDWKKTVEDSIDSILAVEKSWA